MSFSQNNIVPSIYKIVITKVIENCRDAFQDEGLDEHTLQELRQLWIDKLNATRALAPRPAAERRYVYPSQMQQIRQIQPQTIQSSQTVQHIQGQRVQYVTQMPQGVQFQGQQVVFSRQQAPRQVMPQQRIIIQPSPQLQPRPQQYEQQSLNDNQYDGTVEVSDGSSDELSSTDTEEGSDNDPNAVDEPPLDANDDVSEDEPEASFETDNVIICQYDKVARAKNKWRIFLKDGIMNLDGKDYVFNRASGDTDW